MNIIEASLISENARIAISISRFNYLINKNLLEGAIDVLNRIGKVKDKNVTVVWVPGSYELPTVVHFLAGTHKYDGIIALGTIIRGETSHFNFIARECSSGLSKVSIKYMLPVGFGILTTENVDQAIQRSGIKDHNKGADAALVVLEMINLLNILKNSC